MADLPSTPLPPAERGNTRSGGARQAPFDPDNAEADPGLRAVEDTNFVPWRVDRSHHDPMAVRGLRWRACGRARVPALPETPQSASARHGGVLDRPRRRPSPGIAPTLAGRCVPPTPPHRPGRPPERDAMGAWERSRATAKAPRHCPRGSRRHARRRGPGREPRPPLRRGPSACGVARRAGNHNRHGGVSIADAASRSDPARHSPRGDPDPRPFGREDADLHVGLLVTLPRTAARLAALCRVQG